MLVFSGVHRETFHEKNAKFGQSCCLSKTLRSALWPQIGNPNLLKVTGCHRKAGTLLPSFFFTNKMRNNWNSKSSITSMCQLSASLKFVHWFFPTTPQKKHLHWWGVKKKKHQKKTPPLSVPGCLLWTNSCRSRSASWKQSTEIKSVATEGKRCWILSGFFETNLEV